MREAALVSLVVSLSVGLTGVSRAQTPEQCFTIAGIEWAAGTGVASLPVTPAPIAFGASYIAYAANLILCYPYGNFNRIVINLIDIVNFNN